jgi:hypothetical protein
MTVGRLTTCLTGGSVSVRCCVSVEYCPVYEQSVGELRRYGSGASWDGGGGILSWNCDTGTGLGRHNLYHEGDGRGTGELSALNGDGKGLSTTPWLRRIV